MQAVTNRLANTSIFSPTTPPIKAQVITPRFKLPEETFFLTKQEKIYKILECTVIGASLTTVIALSATGVLPAALWISALIGTAGLGLNLILAAGLATKDENSSYQQFLIKSSPITVVLGAPVLEEVIFRGGLQKLLIVIFRVILPAASVIIFGFSLTPAALVGIGFSSLAFGLAHAVNDHKNNWVQAFLATITGLTYGFTVHTLGFSAGIIAHCVNNFFCTTLIYITTPSKPKWFVEHQRQQHLTFQKV